jgi:hypothetical protein
VGGCVSTGGKETVPPLVIDETLCRADVIKALSFKTLPGQTRNFLNGMGENTGKKLRPFLDSYFEVLGSNLSSIALMLDAETDKRISLDIREDMDPADKAKWIQKGLKAGTSLFTLNDISEMIFDGEFLLVTLKPELPLTGYFYIHCGVIEGREIGAKAYVDYTLPGGDVKKVSFIALSNLLQP